MFKQIAGADLKWLLLEWIAALCLSFGVAAGTYQALANLGVYQRPDLGGLTNVLFACLWLLLPAMHLMVRRARALPLRIHAAAVLAVALGAGASLLYGFAGSVTVLVLIECLAIVLNLRSNQGESA